MITVMINGHEAKVSEEILKRMEDCVDQHLEMSSDIEMDNADSCELRTIADLMDGKDFLQRLAQLAKQPKKEV